MEKINDIVMIDTSLVVPNPYQPRKVFNTSAIDELAQSIKEFGILQPITVRAVKDNYEIIMGERRYRAALSINLKKIPAILLEVNNKDSAVVALIENLQRVDLSFIEEAESYKQLIEDHRFKQNDLALKIGKSQSAISNKLRLLKLDVTVLDLFSQSDLTERHARALLKLSDIDDQKKVVKSIIDKNLNVKETEKLIENMCNKIKTSKSTFKINYKIYLNTLKKSFSVIKSMSKDSSMNTLEHDDYMEVIIKIPKN